MSPLRKPLVSPTPLSPHPPEGRLDCYKTAYEEGRRFVDDQLGELDALRQRSAQFIAFIASATGVLVVVALGEHVHRTPVYYLMEAVATVLLLCAFVSEIFLLFSMTLRPKFARAIWNVRLRSDVLVDWVDDPPESDADLHFFRDLALYYGHMATENEPILAQNRRWFLLTVVLSLVQLVIWICVLWVFS